MTITEEALRATITAVRCRRCMGAERQDNPLRPSPGVTYGGVVLVPPTYAHERPCW